MVLIDTLVLSEENKLNRILKDESGFTLVELLAAVVILAIISAISVVAIGNVIQNSREDAGVSNIQQAMNAGQLYYGTEDDEDGAFTLADVIGDGYLNVTDGTFADPGEIQFKGVSDGSLQITVPGRQLQAGSKYSAELPDYTAAQVMALTRDKLFPDE